MVGAALVVVLFAAWTYLQWSIYQHMYSAKAGLDWFGIVFYRNYTFIAAALFSLLLINPRVGHSDLGRLISVLREQVPNMQGPQYIVEPAGKTVVVGRPSRPRWAIWQVTKWAVGFIYFIFTGGPWGLGGLMNPIMMMSMGLGDWSRVPTIFLLPLFPASGTEMVNLIPSLEIQYTVIYSVAWTLVTIFGARMLLRLFANFGSGSGNTWIGLQVRSRVSIRYLLAIAAAVLSVLVMGAPFWLMNVATPFLYGAVLTLLAFSLLAWVHFRGPGRVASAKGPRIPVFKAVAVVAIVGLLIQGGALAFFYFNWNNNFIDYEWYPQTAKEITVTRWAAGLDGIKVGSLLNLPTSNASTTLGLVRQWDQQAAAVTMTKAIGAYNWMTLASSEIVFLNGKEYWVAPTSITSPSTDWISQHLIYTHTSRIMVINTYSGAEVSPEDAFNVSSEPLIYYGESPLSGPGGFYGAVYTHVQGYDEVQNASYGGEPDYTLAGWEKTMWFTFAEGQLGFAFSNQQSSIDMLLNRDVFDRVQSILIPGLVEDPSAYLASDGTNVYYVVQLYIDYPLQSGFAGSPYLRFFGVVLVNVYDGSMQGYTVSNLMDPNSKDFLTTFYERYYDSWHEAPDWLVPQLRYPEQLLGSSDIGPGQLDYDFLFHVNDAFVWRSGSQFYERPLNSSVQYIPWAVENRTYFVGIQLADYQSAASRNLAGMYVAYGGAKLGQIEVYQNPSPSNTFIGPIAAENALTTNSEVKMQLTLLPNNRFGSYLLYSVGGRLTYFVAVYTNPGSGGVVTQLPFITAVDPTTGTVALGSSASAAYYTLTGSNATPPPNDRQALLTEVTRLILDGG
ncbi:MAG TPA: UPF0182 family protein, partial [Candidatus Bathyarchaeia archaeon]|nr:UPF0182 family protein [Candidatus Bathyarchaeia archaeon]